MNEQNQKYYVEVDGGTFKKCRFYLKLHSNANELFYVLIINKVKRVCLNKNSILFYNKNGIFYVLIIPKCVFCVFFIILSKFKVSFLQ